MVSKRPHGYGKGAADGIGGATKRTLDRYVTHGQDIPDAERALLLNIYLYLMKM